MDSPSRWIGCTVAVCVAASCSHSPQSSSANTSVAAASKSAPTSVHYHDQGIDIELPSGWSFAGPSKTIAGLTVGKPVMSAWLGSSSAKATETELVIEILETHHAKTSSGFYSYQRSLWNVKPTGPDGKGSPIIGKWSLKQTDAIYMEWSDAGWSPNLEVYILSPSLKGYWMTCYVPKKEFAKSIPMFEKIVESITFY